MTNDKTPAPQHLPTENIQFLCTYYTEEAKNRQKSVTSLSIFALIVCLIIGSFVLGRVLTRSQTTKIQELADELDRIVTTQPSLGQLNMEQFASLNDERRWEQFRIISEFIQNKVPDGSIRTIEQAKNEAILDGATVSIAEITSDRGRIDTYIRKYDGETVKEFKEHKAESSNLFGSLFSAPPPITGLREMAARYRVPRDLLEPGHDHESISPLLNDVSQAISEIEQKNQTILNMFKKITELDKRIEKVSFDTLLDASRITVVYKELLQELDIYTPEHEFFIKTDQLPDPVATTFDIVRLQLLARVKDRVETADSGIVSGSFFGVEISFPLTFILLTVPFFIPLYCLLVLNHVQQRIYFQKKGEYLLFLLGPSASDKIHRSDTTDQITFKQYFLTRSNWQLIALQILLTLVALPLTIAAIFAPYDAPEFANLRASLGSAWLISGYIIGILVVIGLAWFVETHVSDE